MQPSIQPRRTWLASLGGLPVAAGVVTSIVAVYMLLVTFNNITDFATNQAFVREVLSMNTTFQDPDVTWREIEHPTLQNLAYILIIAMEALATLVLLAATWVWVRSRRTGDFALARNLSSIGFLAVILIFGLGFWAIGGEWFVMWQSQDFNGLEPAGRNMLVAMLGLVLVHLPMNQTV